jgi:glutathione synthase/RimK-type ligase-like ATP-grasp enzyme
MIVGIHIDPGGGFSKPLERYETILDHNGIDHVRLSADQPDFWDRVAKLDLFIFHWIGTYNSHQLAPTILPIVENIMKIPCFPSSVTWWHYDDKIREHYLLQRYKFPIVPSWIFWNKEIACQWLQDAQLPLVFKLKGGASSINVVLVKDKNYANHLINKMFGEGIMSGYVPGTMSLRLNDQGFYKLTKRLIVDKLLTKIHMKRKSPLEIAHRNYVYFQKYLPGNNFDTRITIIGKRAFMARRFNRKDDFRASGSGNADFDQKEIDLRCIKIAYEISKHMDFQMMSYDFLYDENKQPLVSEVSYTSPDWTVWSCPGYWDDNLLFHAGHYWPQYCILSDMLRLPSLKQPEMKI